MGLAAVVDKAVTFFVIPTDNRTFDDAVDRQVFGRCPCLGFVDGFFRRRGRRQWDAFFRQLRRNRPDARGRFFLCGNRLFEDDGFFQQPLAVAVLAQAAFQEFADFGHAGLVGEKLTQDEYGAAFVFFAAAVPAVLLEVPFFQRNDGFFVRMIIGDGGDIVCDGLLFAGIQIKADTVARFR